jgi:tRNA (Thr-GGU) A37 N-methylase
VREVAKNRLRIGPIEAIDGTPVIDIKPVLSEIPDFWSILINAYLDQGIAGPFTSPP